MKKRNYRQLTALSMGFALGLTALSAATAFAGPAGSLNLDTYLQQVEELDPSMKAARAGVEGFTLLHDVGDLRTMPTFFGEYRRLNDQRETQTPAFQGTATKANAFTVGVEMATRFGLSGKYSFNNTNTSIPGADPGFLRQNPFSTAYNQLDLTQSLVKNGFGSQVRANEEKDNATVLQQEYGTRFQAVSRRMQAEQTFWRLAFARRTLELQKDILGRSEKALAWAERRAKLQLADQSDFLQAQANYQLRQLDIQSAQEEIRNAGRAFNLLRNQEGESVAETLNLPTLDETLSVQAPTRGVRYDTLAAGQQQKVSVASAQLAKEEYKPTVDLIASVAFNGRDGSASPSISEAFGTAHPNTTVGINVRVPLAIGRVSRSIQGQELSKSAAQLTYDQKRLDEEQSWSELSSKLRDAQARLKLQRTIEKVQKDKYENERQRLLRGRTTAFQSIQFEQEYAAAQLQSLGIQSEVLGLLAQLKLFQGEKQ